MPFLIETSKDGKIKITDMDVHKEIPCSMCISSAFGLGYTVHDECSEAIAKMTKEEKEKVIQLLNKRREERLKKLTPKEKANICKKCGHFRSQHRPLGVVDYGLGCAIRVWSTNKETGKDELVDCQCKKFKPLESLKNL